jgi:hypothetical protein
MSIVIAKDETSVIRARLAWAEYSEPRFRPGSDHDHAMYHLLRSRVQSEYDRMRMAAVRARCGALDFGQARLLLAVIEALDQPCEYCGCLFGLDDFGVVYDVPPEGRRGGAPARGMANVRVSCGVCCAAKGALSGAEWRDVCAALRAADSQAAAGMLAALGCGYMEKRRKLAKGTTPTPAGCK